MLLPALSTHVRAADDRSPELNKLLKSVESRYNHAQSMKLDFSETYAGMRRPVQSDSGVLYLRKPGRMRWEYATPPGKIFLSDGKEVILYTPDDHRAERSKLKESEDMRAPIAVLLGKLDFGREFKSFETRPENGGTRNGGTWIAATPKSDSLVYTKVEFLATPDGEIHRVRVTAQDQSKLDFTFSNERENVSLPDSLFKFQAPPGVQVVEAGQ
jgi:outer membrane lipoprotein carrier protein